MESAASVQLHAVTTTAAPYHQYEEDNDGSQLQCELEQLVVSQQDHELNDEDKSKLSQYQAAALLVHEGEDNEKFTSRPKGRLSSIAYNILHHPIVYWMVFAICLALMAMACLELPTIPQESEFKIQERMIHLLLELCLLVCIALALVLRWIWVRPRAFLTSRATIMAVIVLVMVVEVMVLLVRDERHLRVTRALRPILLLDTYLMAGVRRIVRQIIHCAKYILDVMLVLFFLIALAALMAYFLFAAHNPTYFDSLVKSFVSMIITLTTANHPDVFMESYLDNPASPLFFAIYLLITFYYLSNLLLAVVFAKFKDEDKKKYKRLYLHRRSALHRAYTGITAGSNNQHLHFQDFLFLMRLYKPQLAEHEVMCVYKDLQLTGASSSEGLTIDEFEHLYECLGMKWELVHRTGSAVAWFESIASIPSQIQVILEKVHRFIAHWSFDTAMSFVVISNLLFLIIYITTHDATSCKFVQFCAAQSTEGLAGSFLFTTVYVIEISLRLVLEGARRYFRKWWNWFDFTIVMGCFLLLCIEAILHDSNDDAHYWVRYLVMARPLKFIRLLRLKRSYFYLVKTMIALTYRLLSMLFLMLCVFYSFAIIGMEVFGGKDSTVYPGCCENASYGVGQYFSSNGTGEPTPNVYWLNNFTTLYSSYVTLYEEMVINNWYIQMEGFVSTTSWAARIYFILFWITTTIVVNTGIVYIVDGFELCFLALNTEQKMGNHRIYELKKTVEIDFTEEDIRLLQSAIIHLDKCIPRRRTFSLRACIRGYRRVNTTKLLISMQNFKSRFRGKSTLSNEDLLLLMHHSEVPGWIKNSSSDVPSELLFHRHHASGSMTGKQEFKNLTNELLSKAKAVAAYVFK